MSASSKLRELDASATPGKLWIEPNEHELRAPNGRKPITTAVAPWKGGNRAHGDMVLYAALRNSVVALADVLDAAEAMADSFDEMCGPLSTIDDFRAAVARLGEVLHG